MRTGSPAFQFVKVTGRPVDIQKKLPSSPWSVPAVQKCSFPKPSNQSFFFKFFIGFFFLMGKRPYKWDTYRILWCVSRAGRSRFGSRCWPVACRGNYRIWPTCTNLPVVFRAGKSGDEKVKTSGKTVKMNWCSKFALHSSETGLFFEWKECFPKRHD